MKKILVLSLVAVLVAVGAGITNVSQWVENYGGYFYFQEYDEIDGGNEQIVLINGGGDSQFGKNIVAGSDWMMKGEYVGLYSDCGSCLYKFEEIEWWATEDPEVGDPPALVYINKMTVTEDLFQLNELEAKGDFGSYTMEITSEEVIYELGQIAIWHGDWNDDPGLVPARKDPVPKPPLPPIPDP